MAKIYFHVDVNSAFLSWSALKALQDGGTVDLPRQAVRHQNGGEPLRGPHQMPGADGRAAGF